MELIQYLLIISVPMLAWLWLHYRPGSSRPWSTYSVSYFWRCSPQSTWSSDGLLDDGVQRTESANVKWWDHWLHHRLQKPVSFTPTPLGTWINSMFRMISKLPHHPSPPSRTLVYAYVHVHTRTHSQATLPWRYRKINFFSTWTHY